MSLSLTAIEAGLCQQAQLAARTACTAGADASGTPIITGLMTVAQYDASPTADFIRAVAAGVAKILTPGPWTTQGGPMTAPFQLPFYTANPFTNPPPAAADHEGALVWIPDDAGGPIVAFSDGTTWRRCDTGADIS